MQDIYRLLWAVAPGIITSIVMAFFSRRMSRINKRREDDEKDKRKEAKLNLDLTFASAQLAYASAMALKRGRPNGEVEEGIKAYNKAMETYRNFEREQMSKVKVD